MASDKQNLESLKKYKIEGDTARRWLSNKQIKHKCRIHEKTLQKLRRAKLLPFQGLGGTIFYEYLELTKSLTHKKTNEKD